MVAGCLADEVVAVVVVEGEEFDAFLCLKAKVGLVGILLEYRSALP